MAIAADGQARIRPMAADTAHQAANMAANLAPGRGLPGPQQDRHRARGGDVIDMDGHEAALVMVRVEQGKLLMPVHDVDGVVDVQRHLGGWAGEAGAVGVDHGVGQANDLAQRRCVLPARHGRLRAQIMAAVWQATAGEFEPGVCAEVIEVVGVLVAAGDGEHAGTQDVGDAMRHEQRIARVHDQPSKSIGDPYATLGGCQQQDAAIGGDAAAIERRGDFLAADGWKEEGRGRIVKHGGCGLGVIA
jgi:hypothetical protein